MFGWTQASPVGNAVTLVGVGLFGLGLARDGVRELATGNGGPELTARAARLFTAGFMVFLGIVCLMATLDLLNLVDA